LDGCHELQAKDGRVVLLPALSDMLFYDARVKNRDWLDVQEEYWAAGDVDGSVGGQVVPELHDGC